ncbi:MAG TPA: MBL fold metallo-hydrolase [Candidatus Dormibacteraeota bacterium]|nr:MBL fold metallo-hydrolase [Candidatus Dormibacteraeota bacterium]
MARATTVLTFLATGNPTGLKFTVEHGGARALFDFGREHAPGRNVFSLGLEPRPGRELEDLLAVGMAPQLEGVYRSWDGRTSVFISHMHLDHTMLVRHLHPDVPLYYPAAMEELRAACVATGYAAWRTPAGIAAEDRQTIRCGEIEVEFVAVDHDLPGATGFLVRTPDLRLAYTSDHRWHGLHPELTETFAHAAHGVDVLVQEAVSLAPRDPPITAGGAPPERLTEAQVMPRIEEAMDRIRGLVVVNLYPMNRERVAALGRAAHDRGRVLLLEPREAAVAGWNVVLDDVQAVASDPSRYCVGLSFGSLPTLIDLKPPEGSAFIQSDGSPLGTWDPAWNVMLAWIQAFGLELIHIGSSGHSAPDDITRMVRTVGPGLVLPVHTRAPEALEVGGVARLIPVPLQPYTAAQLRALKD